MLKRASQIPFLLILFLLVLAACSPVSGATGISTLPAVTSPQATLPQNTVRDAQVESVEIQINQSDPRQVSAIVRGNLNDSCSALQNPKVRFESGTFHIQLTVASPNDRGCVQIITPFEQSIALDTADLSPGSYSVTANDKSTAFNFLAETAQPLNASLQLVVRAADGSFKIANLSIPLNPVARPTFNNFLPDGGSAAGNAYVLDNNQAKAVVTDGKGFHELEFVQSPTPYGLAVWPGDANTQPRLAWATHNVGGDQSSTLKISAPDGTQFDTLLTQEALNPPSQLMAEFFSADGQWLYFSKEPVGLGGYILFSGASNLYKININTKVVVEVIPQGNGDSPQACLDAISADLGFVADHCAQNAITIRNLSSGEKTTIQPPADLNGYKLIGSARFSPDGSRLAFALARGDQPSEQGWVAVSDGPSGGSKLVLTAQAGSYDTVDGWLDDQTLLVQSTNPTDCSPLCKSELWTVKADGTGALKVADGSFLAAVPNDAFIQLPAGPTSTPEPAAPTPESVTPTSVATACTDVAQYISDDGLDGTTYAPNTAFTKTWTVKNTGTCTWDSRYLVYQVSGVTMTQQPGYWIVSQGQTVAPGQTVDIRVGMTSYPKNGKYRSDWGLKNAAGQVIPIEHGTVNNTFYVVIKVSDGTDTGKVTASAIDISLEQGSGEVCTANATYFVHAYISTDGPATLPYEIGSSAGQIAAGYFEDENGQHPYVTGELVFDKADTKQVNLRFVGPYPHPNDITVMLRVAGGEWYNTKLFCP